MQIIPGRQFKGKPHSSGLIYNQRVDPYKARRARELRRNMTPAEIALWQQLRRKQVGGKKFRRQQVIKGFIADFYCEKAKLVVEVDGSVHRTPEQQSRDGERDARFTEMGLTLVRFENREVLKDLPGVLDRIREIMEKTK